MGWISLVVVLLVLLVLVCLAVVELEDSLHHRAKVKLQDAFVNGALEAAGVRVKWGPEYDLEEVAWALWETDIARPETQVVNQSAINTRR